MSSFWQVPSTEEKSSKYTGFLFNNKVYNYKVVPFGLKTCWAALIKTIYLTLIKEEDDFVLGYVDDLLLCYLWTRKPFT